MPTDLVEPISLYSTTGIGESSHLGQYLIPDEEIRAILEALGPHFDYDELMDRMALTEEDLAMIARMQDPP